MNELLDDEGVLPKTPKSTAVLRKFGFAYVFVMLLGSFSYATFNSPEFDLRRSLILMFALIFIPFVINAFIEFLLVLFSSFKTGERKQKSPLWFRLIEGTVSIWLVIIIITIIMTLVTMAKT
jgi:hypothetical protein